MALSTLVYTLLCSLLMLLMRGSNFEPRSIYNSFPQSLIKAPQSQPYPWIFELSQEGGGDNQKKSCKYFILFPECCNMGLFGSKKPDLQSYQRKFHTSNTVHAC